MRVYSETMHGMHRLTIGLKLTIDGQHHALNSQCVATCITSMN